MKIYVKNTDSINEILKQTSPGDTLVLEDGIYKEKIEVWIPSITIKALNKHRAVISNNDYYHKIMPNYNECNTFNTFSLYIGSDNVTLQDLIIENTATPSEIYGQAVALHVDGTKFKCENCIIKSAQDTLFTGPMPADLLVRYKGFYEEKRLKGTPSIQEYYNCKIIGDVDFIFGCATALFKNCEIITLATNKKHLYICSPSHPKELKYGYLFYNCTLKTYGSSSTFLGRPWRDYGCAAFIKCNMEEANILPEGFNKWDNTNRDKTARFYEYTENINLENREKWINLLTKNEAKAYIDEYKKYISK